MPSKSIQFTNRLGLQLAARLELPLMPRPLAYVVFAHVFTGSKNLKSARHISRALTSSGFAVLRFDFAGLGESEGDFSDTNFRSNINDIKDAAAYLNEHYEAPSLIVGHSLGGAAALFAAKEMDSILAVATIGAPSEPEHVTHLFGCELETIEKNGFAEVELSGRKFTIRKQFIDDLRAHDLPTLARKLRKALLVMHSPKDATVAIKHAANIYHAALHPKSFVTLDTADHLLTNKHDAAYAGQVIASWAHRYLDIKEVAPLNTNKQVLARLMDSDIYTTEIKAGKHSLLADESESLGGNDFGASPYELLSASIAACKAMTLRMYANRKKWDLEEVKVHISYDRSYKEDCEGCSREERKIETFDVELELIGDLDDAQKARLMEISERCPVHRTLNGSANFQTKVLGEV